MFSNKEPLNPFYALLVVLGIVFFITACAYGVMAFKAVRPVAAASAPEAEPSPSGARLMEFMDHWGMPMMAVELILLGVATVGAMATDQYWYRRAAEQAAAKQSSSEATTSTTDSAGARPT